MAAIDNLNASVAALNDAVVKEIAAHAADVKVALDKLAASSNDPAIEAAAAAINASVAKLVADVAPAPAPAA